jgi:hypothetical protein
MGVETTRPLCAPPLNGALRAAAEHRRKHCPGHGVPGLRTTETAATFSPLS